MTNKKLAAAALAGALCTGLTQAASLEWMVIGQLPVPVIVSGHVRLPAIVPPVIVPQVHVRHAPVPVIYAPAYGRGYGDRDGDGIPNRYDRVYNPRWDRDGDGVPNWRDRDYGHRHYNRQFDRHDRHDRHDRQYGRHDRQDRDDRHDERRRHH